MAADVRAFLEARPVSARAARPLYLMAKFAQRNRTAVWTAGMAALGLATALTATILQGRLAAALGVALLAVAAVLALAQARRVATARDAATRAGDDARAQLDRVKRVINDLVFRYGDTVTHMPGGAQAQEGMLRNIVTLLEPTVQGGTDDLDLIATMASVLGRLTEIQGNSLMTDRARWRGYRHCRARAGPGRARMGATPGRLALCQLAHPHADRARASAALARPD